MIDDSIRVDESAFQGKAVRVLRLIADVQQNQERV